MNILNFIKNIILTETFQGFSSIHDRYLNGDCLSLALLLAKTDNHNGAIFKIEQSDNNLKYHHYIYKKDNLFYDINGEQSSVLKLMENIDYFNINKEFTIEKFDIDFKGKDIV